MLLINTEYSRVVQDEFTAVLRSVHCSSSDTRGDEVVGCETWISFWPCDVVCMWDDGPVLFLAYFCLVVMVLAYFSLF